MVTVQVWHLPTSFDPYFVLGVFTQVVQASNIESEFASLCEFANQHTGRQQFLLGDICAHICDCMIEVEYSILDEAKHRWANWIGNQVLE